MAAGKTLKDFYMSQDVSRLFLPNTFIDWKTGKEVEMQPGKPFKSHCSEFASSIANTMGIPLYPTPDQVPQYLSDHIYHWLAGERKTYPEYDVQEGQLSFTGKNIPYTVTAHDAGWREVTEKEAYLLAQQGVLVLAVVPSPPRPLNSRKKPGHVPVVLPDSQVDEKRRLKVLSVGSKNHKEASIPVAFKAHRNWETDLKFFAHPILVPPAQESLYTLLYQLVHDIIEERDLPGPWVEYLNGEQDFIHKSHPYLLSLLESETSKDVIMSAADKQDFALSTC